MPRQSAGISKLARIEALRETLARWGKLEKHSIDQYVAARLSCDPNEISRTLYRDLEELERMGEIVAAHFSRDGLELTDYNPEIHRNTYCEWSLTGLERSIRGSGRLRKSKVLLASSSRLARGLNVTDGKRRTDSPERIGIYFHAGGDSHCILLEKKDLPARFLIGRISEADTDVNALTAAEKLAGKRTACLLVPISSVSSLRSGRGHLIVSFESESRVKLQDLGSKNGSFYVPLNEAQAASLIQENANFGNATATDVVSPVRAHLDFKTLPANSETLLELPLLIRLSTAFEAILVASKP